MSLRRSRELYTPVLSVLFGRYITYMCELRLAGLAIDVLEIY